MVIETQEISGFSNISKQTVIAGDSANIANETNKLQSDNIEKLNETRTRNNKIGGGVVIALPPLPNQSNDFENEIQFIQIVEGNRHQTSKANLENARINNEILSQYNMQPEKKVIALPRTPPQLHANDSIVIIEESEMRHLIQAKNQINKIKYSDAINNGHVTQLPRSLTDPDITDSFEMVEDNDIYMKSGSQNRIGTTQEVSSMTNYPPVAVPDVYTTRQGGSLVVSAPGHLANDTDPEGDPVTWVAFGTVANGTITGATPDGAFTYTPDPGFAGVDQFTVVITDGQGNFTDGLVIILVEQNSGPRAVPDVYTTRQGEPLVVSAPGHLANDTDPEGDPLIWVSFGFPADGAISGAATDGAFIYTPDPGFSGINSFPITISDGQGNFSSGLVIILIEPNYAPTAVPEVYTTPQGEPLVVSAPGHLANDTDPEGDPLAWVSFGFPANGTVTNATPDGAFTYTPDPGFSGTDSFVITITDGKGNFTNGIVSLLVEENYGPTVVPDLYAIQEGLPLVVSAPGHLANDTDPEGDPLTWVSFGAVANGTVTGATPDGAFTYTPDPGFKGTDSFVITITDGQDNFSSGLITISVQPADELFAVPDAYATPKGEPLVVAAPGHLANDFDPEGNPLTWISFGFPANGTVSGATPDGAFTYTPDPGFSGTDAFVITISDGQGNFANGLVVILVEENFAPEAVPDVYTTPRGEPLVVSAPGHLANDTDPEGDPLTWVSFGFPANGTLSGATPNGSFTYTPDPGFAGIDFFVITISDGQGSFSNGLISILVEENLAPMSVPDVYATPHGQPLVVSAPGHLTNDTDPEGDPLSWISFGFPANGTVSGATPDGAFTYTPDPGFVGTDSFVITITDGKGNFNSGLVSILVEENLSPTAVPDVYTTPQGEPLVVSAPGHLANDTDPEGDLLAWVSFGFPANGAVSGATPDGAFTYTPDPGFAGIDQFLITITDGQGNFTSGLVAVLVEPNTPPIADAGADLTVVVSLAVTLDGSGSFDPDGDPITYNWMFATPDASNPVPSGSAALLSNDETATPSFVADLPGVYSVKLIVNDGLADSDPDYVIVTALSIIEALDNLIADVEVLGSDRTLNKGQVNSLVKKIEQAQNLIDKNKFYEALDVLYGLRQQVLDLYQQDGVLTESQAMALIEKIDDIITAIENQASLAMNSQEDVGVKSGNGPQKELLSPEVFALSAIYPNPFRISAEIAFNVSVAAKVRIEVYNIFSQIVAVLQDGYIEAGQHTVLLSAGGLKNGTYIVRMTAGEEFYETRRIILVR